MFMSLSIAIPSRTAYLCIMARAMRQNRQREDEQQASNRQTASLAALAILLALVIASLVVMKALNSRAAIEDCLMSGRRNCDAVVLQESNR